MRNSINCVLTSLTAVTAATPAMTTTAQARHNGADIAGGVILGAAALAIIANSNRAHAAESDDGYTPEERHCDNGFDNACQQYNDDCRGG